MHRVSHRALLVWLHRDAKLDGLRILLREIVGLFGDFPVAPAVEVLYYFDFHRCVFLAVTQLDFERFVNPESAARNGWSIGGGMIWQSCVRVQLRRSVTGLV